MDTDNSIIIIDDDKRNIFALSMVLKSRGYNSLSAQSFKEGLQVLELNPQLKVILIDMMMPEIDGYQGIAILKKHISFKNLPIVAITAQAMEGDRERCLTAGADGYVSKPINIDVLMVFVNKFLTNA